MVGHRMLAFICIGMLFATVTDAAQTLEVHFSGLQVIASDPAKRDEPLVDEVWVLSVSNHHSASPSLLQHLHRSYLKLGCDDRGRNCEEVLAVDGMDLELRSPVGGVTITPVFRNGILRFGADLGYGDLDPRLLQAESGRRDDRISSRFRILGGTLDVDRAQGSCSFAAMPAGGVGDGTPRTFFLGGFVSTSIPNEGAWIDLTDRRTGEVVGSIRMADRTDAGNTAGDEIFHVWYTHEPDTDNPPHDLYHYLLLSILGDGPGESAKVPVIHGLCPLPAVSGSTFCPDGQYP